MRALRRDHNPARARALLESYLGEHPSGALAEEALAMSIEAALARQDVADAHRLAARYVRLYPTGPFHVMATRTLSDLPMD
jgi:outer membrane protein assembly factor BamD (BamD/ComL family)